MGLFSSNYSKPGPGVSKDAPKKKGIFLYIEILGRKIFKLFQISWLYCLCSLPYLILMFFYSSYIFGGYIQQLLQGFTEANSNLSVFVISCFITMFVFVLWGSGPASAGFAYVTRCFSREEHAWILSDFFVKTKENFKQSMILVIIDFVTLFVISNAIIQYWSIYAAGNNMIWLLLMYICILILFLYTFIHFNIYQLMVTYDCKFKDLIKNSLLLSLGRAPINLILMIFASGLMIVAFNYLHPLEAVLVVLVIAFGFIRFPIEFNSARMIEKIIKTSSEVK